MVKDWLKSSPDQPDVAASLLLFATSSAAYIPKLSKMKIAIFATLLATASAFSIKADIGKVSNSSTTKAESDLP